MKIYWSYRSIPELAELDKKQARRVWYRSYYKALWRHWQIWVGALLGGCCAGLGVWLGIRAANWPYSHDSNIWLLYLGAIIGGTVGGFISLQIIIPHVIPYIRQSSRKIHL